MPQIRSPALVCWAVTLFLAVWALGGVSAQRLNAVPETVTRELGTYYLSKLGLAEGGLPFYAILYGRNNHGFNVYNKLNGVGERDSPRDAANKMSAVKAIYSTHTIGGRITVESFYSLLRCEDYDECFRVSRVIAAGYLPAGGFKPTHILTPVKTTMGNSQWEVNAPQAVVNKLLATGYTEQGYRDEVYKTQMFYKVPRSLPTPCSSATPLTLGGSLAEYFGLPGFQCISVNRTILMVGARQSEMVDRIKNNKFYSPVSPSACDGSLGLLYTRSSTAGPEIYRVIRTGGVPFTIQLQLPPYCFDLYSNPDLTIQAAAAVLNANFTLAVGQIKPSAVPQLARLGFSDTCAPTFFYGSYGFIPIQDQGEELTEGVDNKAYTDAFIPYSDSACISALGESGPGTSMENMCAQFWFGNATQLQEGIITYNDFPPNTSLAAANFYKSSLERVCNKTYNTPIEVLLSQIAVDFEAEKDSLLSSTEVKLHLDSVAVNAASVLAVEVALATSGTIIAGLIARLGLFRRRRVPSSVARAFALLATAVVITVFNIPNFALIDRSLSNHGKVAVYTEASIHNYRPSNYSLVLKAETHTFVGVEGSSATAVIGIFLYCVTLSFALYLTWSEFTDIIRRRDAAESRLGQEAFLADRDLLVQWRGMDSLLYDTLHSKTCVDSTQAPQVESALRNLGYLAHSNGGGVQFPQRFRQQKPNGRSRNGDDLYDRDTYTEL